MTKPKKKTNPPPPVARKRPLDLAIEQLAKTAPPSEDQDTSGISQTIRWIVRTGDAVDQRRLLDALLGWGQAGCVPIGVAHAVALEKNKHEASQMYLEALMSMLSTKGHQKTLKNLEAIYSASSAMNLCYVLAQNLHPLTVSAFMWSKTPATIPRAKVLLEKYRDHSQAMNALQGGVINIVLQKNLTNLQKWMEEVVIPLGEPFDSKQWAPMFETMVRHMLHGASDTRNNTAIDKEMWEWWGDHAPRPWMEHLTKELLKHYQFARQKPHIKAMIKHHVSPQQWLEVLNTTTLKAAHQTLNSSMCLLAQEIMNDTSQPQRIVFMAQAVIELDVLIEKSSWGMLRKRQAKTMMSEILETAKVIDTRQKLIEQTPVPTKAAPRSKM